MKKSIVLSLLAATTLLSASNFKYSKSYPSNYLFGFTGILQANNAELENGISGDTNYGWGVALDTYQTYEYTERMFLGVKSGATYMFGTGYLDTNSWGLYVEPRFGFKATQQIHLYVGAGYQYDSYEEADDYIYSYDPQKGLDYVVDGPYISLGMDYIMSKDMIVGIKYTRGVGLSIDNEQVIGEFYEINQEMDQNKIRIELTIPFR